MFFNSPSWTTLAAMGTLTVAHNSALANYMATSGLSQMEMAASIGKSQSWLSKRLNGQRRWTLDDLDALQRAGIPVGEFLYSQLPMGDIDSV